jgi:hypothetical protein
MLCAYRRLFALLTGLHPFTRLRITAALLFSAQYEMKHDR